MSDTRLRELERRWKETGSSDDEAAYLLERVRVGDLTQERLELAAYCGHEGAGRALGRPMHPTTGAEEWIQRMSARFGADVGLRALLLLLSRTHHEGPRSLIQDARELLEDGLRALDGDAADVGDLGHGADSLRYRAWDLPHGPFRDWIAAVAHAALAVEEADLTLLIPTLEVPPGARMDVAAWAISRRAPHQGLSADSPAP